MGAGLLPPGLQVPKLGQVDDAYHAMRLQEASFHLDIPGLKALKTAVLVTGGMCSKLFGIGLMGYLAFQSMQANVSKPQRQEQMQQGYYSRGQSQEYR